jgi:hypothetical protein
MHLTRQSKKKMESGETSQNQGSRRRADQEHNGGVDCAWARPAQPGKF